MHSVIKNIKRKNIKKKNHETFLIHIYIYFLYVHFACDKHIYTGRLKESIGFPFKLASKYKNGECRQ